MALTRSQRAEHGVARWKAPGDLFDPRRFEVAPIEDDSTARAFVETHHYARSYPAAGHRFGLYDRAGELQGVAVFSIGTNVKTISNVFGAALVPWQEAFELGRFVLRDAVPFNAESWFLARCFERLAVAGVKGVVSFSDPYPRRRQDGALVFPGHWGQIYQASNALYTGRGTARTLRLLPDGTVLSDRAIQKVRQQERGWRATVETLRAHGAPALAADTEWLSRALASCTRTVRHPGNHRYVFRLGRRGPPVLVAEQERPRHVDPAAAMQLGLALWSRPARAGDSCAR